LGSYQSKEILHDRKSLTRINLEILKDPSVESVAYQGALPEWLKRRSLPVIEVKQTADKITRLTGLAPYFENGTFRIDQAA